MNDKSAARQQKLETLRRFPQQLRSLVTGLADKRLLATPIEDEWSIAQIVHHCADSHLNGFTRLKLVITEDSPSLKPYDEASWGQLADANHANIENSLQLLDGLHPRFVMAFENLSDEQWLRSGEHMAVGTQTVDDLLDVYASHCSAHLSQIRRTLAAQPSKLERKVQRSHLALMQKTFDTVAHVAAETSQEAAMSYRDGGDGWTTLEVIGHLHDADKIFGARVRAILENEGAPLMAFDHEGLVEKNRYNDRELADLMNDFRASRQALVALFESFGNSAEIYTRAGTHPEYGAWAIMDSLIQVGHHDVTHLEQLTKILSEKLGG